MPESPQAAAGHAHHRGYRSWGDTRPCIRRCGGRETTVLRCRILPDGVVLVIVLGIILLIIGFIAKIAILWTIGIILVVIGAILFLLGSIGREVGGRRHWY